MANTVTLTIDGIQVTVPAGMVVVDAAKKAGVDIPVFCYHPKMEPVGMCRMCLVEIGRPVVDRATGAPVLEADGKPKIQFTGKLETACTTTVTEGMQVLGLSENAKAGRNAILEFLLTSHPLDCPICDKGGECPLQNLTMKWGPGRSRYLYDEKMHLAKDVPLGELIVLDRERCIQCGRCVRFQSDIVDEPVIGFSQRGRSLEIISNSEPGFDSYFSGNTTDICPVGALTTSDFRFRARPWELKSAATICTQCPVGCNLTLNVRREAVSGGQWVIKRVMPRQNEAVNEIWICDKGRFGYHFSDKTSGRITQPLVRQDGELKPASWEQALELVAERFKLAGDGLLTLAGGRLSNEDLFNLQSLTQALGGKTVLYTHMAGGDLTTQVGLEPGTNLADLGPKSAVLVVGCDLEEEAPVWWLRIKQAADRGAELIVLNARATSLDRHAKHSLRYPFGNAAAAVLAMVNALSAKRPELPEAVKELARSQDLQSAAKALAEAENAIVLFGSDGLGLAESSGLAQACANLVVATGHIGRPNNGLLGVWPHANDQGAWEIGWRPQVNLSSALGEAKALYIAAADPAGDDPAYQAVFGGEKFVVVQELFLTQTARLADVVLPAQAWTEREGSFTSGERRVQRYYPAAQATTTTPIMKESPSPRKAPLLTSMQPSLTGPLADFTIPALIAEQMGNRGVAGDNAASVFLQLAEKVPVFKGLTYRTLAEVTEQWPIVGRGDLYYGGTTYENKQGLGQPLPLASSAAQLVWPQVADFRLPMLGLMAFPVTCLYDKGATLVPSKLLSQRIGEPHVRLSTVDAGRLKVSEGSMVRVSFSGSGASVVVMASLDPALPERVILIPRSFGIPVSGPVQVEVRPA